MPDPANPSESPTEELRRLKAAEAKRREEAEAEEAARELEELRLVETLSEGGKRRGVDFEVVNTAFGVFGLRLPDAHGIKQWNRATSEKEVDTDRLVGILSHYIIPESDMPRFRVVASTRPGVVTGIDSLGNAFNALTGAVRFDAKKK